jgi:hypothetical protein
MTGQERINNWGIKKYNLPEGTVISFEADSEWGGCCETCAYEQEFVSIMAKRPEEKWPSEIDRRYSSLTEMLIEIMGD